jgi:phage baseplate assembly protein W
MAVYSDIDIGLKKAQDGDVVKDTEFDAVENSISNILSTLKGERRMLPEFASNIYSILFEPIDEITSRRIGSEIFHSLQIWDNRITIENINVNANHDKNQYEITIRYSIKDIQPEEIKEVDFILKQE